MPEGTQTCIYEKVSILQPTFFFFFPYFVEGDGQSSIASCSFQCRHNLGWCVRSCVFNHFPITGS